MKANGQPVRVTCSFCHKTVSRKPEDLFAERAIAGEETVGIVEVGSRCPNCGDFRRAAFDSLRLKALRAELQRMRGPYRETLRAQYEVQFNQLQQRMKSLEAVDG